MISGLEPYAVPVAEDALVFAVDMYDRYHDILAVKIKVTETIGFAEGFTAIFEIADEMAMPYDPQRICFRETYFYFGGMCECLLQDVSKINLPDNSLEGLYEN